ncbi:MAG: acyl-CoA thioesterase [Gammaproteobacteria bacterium]
MTSTELQYPYEIEIEIRPSDIDQLGHVNNVVYLKWVQDVATAHWYASATDEQKASLLWVVTKHEIEYKRPAFVQDVVIASTWVGKANHRFFERHTELRRKSDGKLLAKATTLWAPVDMNTKKPVEVGQDVYEMFST